MIEVILPSFVLLQVSQTHVREETSGSTRPWALSNRTWCVWQPRLYYEP